MKRICVILAGGSSRRMGEADKAEMLLDGMRLIDRVAERLTPQCDEMLISGPQDYGTELGVVADHADGPRGPAAGLHAAAEWMAANNPSAKGFFTVPVDGPFLPDDLTARLGASGQSALAEDDDGIHPTFAYWALDALRAGLLLLSNQPSLSLQALAKSCGALTVSWPASGAFFNINRQEDLETARQMIGH